MMRLLLTLFLCAIPSFGQTVLSGAVMPEGWIVVLRISNGATNGTFDFNWQTETNGVPYANHAFKLTLNSPGYDATGATSVWSGTFYGTKELRFAYPGNAFSRTVMDGTDVLVYLALSGFVCQSDTDLTATIGAGLYDWTTDANDAATITLTNWSAQPYPKVIANWSDVGFQQITNANSAFRSRAVGFHASGTQGRPLAAMQFFATDESGDVVTNTETRMRIDWDLDDIIPTGEYYTDFDLSSLTHSNLVRFDFRALPWRGDSSAVLDTRDDMWAWPTYLPNGRTNFYYTNAYGGVAVAATTGNDSTGVTYPSGTDPTTIPSGEYYASGGGAANDIQAYNNSNYGHDDVGGGVVYLKEGLTSPFGVSLTYGSTPKTWIRFQNYPGDTVTLTNAAGTDDISDRVWLYGLNIEPITTVVQYRNIEALWLDHCVLDSSGVGPIWNDSSAGVIYHTYNSIDRWNAAIPYSTHVQSIGLMRGCTIDNFTGSGGIVWFNALGNRRVPSAAASGFVWVDERSPMGVATRDVQISYNNYLMGITNISGANINTISGNAWGKAFIQNVLEFTHTGGASFSVSAGVNNTTNILWEADVVEGARNQWFYNETGSTGAVKVLNSVRNSIFVVLGEATDIGTVGQEDGARTNDWSMRWRVGGQGIINQVLTNAPTHSNPEFNGLNSYRPLLASGATTLPTWIRYVDGDGMYRGGTGDGNGNYRLQSDSRALHDDYTHRDWSIPFDMDGNPRGKFDPPGAFNAGNFRRGGFF